MNKVMYQDSVGSPSRASGPYVKDAPNIPEILRNALTDRFGLESRLTPIQSQALEAGICEANQHFLVSAPTNSGKTLVALFRIFSEVLSKKVRCVYVTPLKALAEEKRAELEDLCEKISQAGGRQVKVSITTGDYQQTNDFLGSPPPENGELIICTPERLEILLRSNENIYWARAVSTFVVDEFHLLGEPRRGATMEILLTRILVSCPWSRIVALSASMGGMDAVQKWLGQGGIQVTLLDDQWRFPVLERQVVETEDKNAFVTERVQNVLAHDNRSLLIFVSKKNESDQLAKALRKEFPSCAEAITSMHAGLTLKNRHERLIGLRNLTHRVVVATTALKMGIDAPVTDVIVRDTYLWGQQGANQLTYADLLQMTGRAGRRDQTGKAMVLCDPGKAGEVTNLFRDGTIEPIQPQLMGSSRKKTESLEQNPVLSILLTEVVMKEKATTEHLNRYLRYTFFATHYNTLNCQKYVNELIRLKLIYQEDARPDISYPTKLGKTVALTGISPESGAILAGFLRALINLDEKYKEKKGRPYKYLKRLTDLDLIFLCCSCLECRSALLKQPSQKAISDVQEFIETLPPEEKPIVNLWFDEDSSEYPTRRLLTSLRMPFDANKKGQAEKVFYKLMQSSVLLYQHARGTHLSVLATKFKTSLGELENNLKFNVLWLLNCLSQICNPKRCYKLDYIMMRAYKLIECLSVGSKLGEVMRIDGVGRRSVEKLIENDLHAIDDLEKLSKHDLINMGIQNRQADLILKSISKSR